MAVYDVWLSASLKNSKGMGGYMNACFDDNWYMSALQKKSQWWLHSSIQNYPYALKK